MDSASRNGPYAIAGIIAGIVREGPIHGMGLARGGKRVLYETSNVATILVGTLAPVGVGAL